MAKDITTLNKAIASQYGNLDAEYTNPSTDEAWESVTQYIEYKRNKFSNPPKNKTILVKQENGTDAEMTNRNQSSVNTFVLSQSSVNCINNLASTSTTDPLSAAQGKALNDKINAIPSPKNSTVTISHNGEVKGSFSLNQENNTTIDVGDGQERIFTADFLRKALLCNLWTKVYIASGSDMTPAFCGGYNSFPEPAGQTTWMGQGSSPASVGNNCRLMVHNFNCEPWKGRTFKITPKQGYKIAICTGICTQGENPSPGTKPYPSESTIEYSWHTYDDPIIVTLGDMISLIVRSDAGNSLGNPGFLYNLIWGASASKGYLFNIEETEDSVQNAPWELRTTKYAGYRIGMIGDSILAGASTTAWRTAAAVLLQEYGIIACNRSIAGSGIAPSGNSAVQETRAQFKDRIDGDWGLAARGYNGMTDDNVGKPYDKTLGVVVFGVNDVLMNKKPIDEHPFKRVETKLLTGQTVPTLEVVVAEDIDAEGYVSGLLELYNKINSSSASSNPKLWLAGPYNCIWPGNHNMSTTGVNPNGDTGEDYVRVQAQLCMIKGWNYLNLLPTALNMRAGGLSTDSLHPNMAGHKILGELLGAWFTNQILGQVSPVFYEKREVTIGSETLNILVEL